MSTRHITPIEPGNRIQLPAEWADSLGLRQRVVLDRTTEGILVRPCPPTTWDDIFATKLTIGSKPSEDGEEAAEMTSSSSPTLERDLGTVGQSVGRPLCATRNGRVPAPDHS